MHDYHVHVRSERIVWGLHLDTPNNNEKNQTHVNQVGISDTEYDPYGTQVLDREAICWRRASTLSAGDGPDDVECDEIYTRAPAQRSPATGQGQALVSPKSTVLAFRELARAGFVAKGEWRRPNLWLPFRDRTGFGLLILPLFTNTTTNVFEQPITERLEVPARFGEDGGKFYYYYDQLADELDEDLTKRLKAQLDSLLIFAGLFAGVNSAFLALTLPIMTADPADDTNALLLQLDQGGNATINSKTDLPSATFSPPDAIYPVNMLFAVSLTCALMSSFLAVLGQQWLVYYRKRSGGGADHQRKDQLRRQLGAQRWQLELVLDDILPALLLASLAIFSISFILYLRTLSGSMSSVVSAIVGTALAVSVGAAVCATWDRMCPYQSPLSHLLCCTMERMKPVAVALVWLFVFVKAYLHQTLWTPTHRAVYSSHTEKPHADLWNSANQIIARGITRLGRREETSNDLVVASVKRVILTSEHTAALIHTATNICAIDDENSVQGLINDAEFFDRLHVHFGCPQFVYPNICGPYLIPLPKRLVLPYSISRSQWSPSTTWFRPRFDP
ncbi:hypothetical protein FRC00_001819 [Tulasnella sp. 408]|nr:hypothetical protein FRC00_001819 [Tulasnella sp. 408]